MPLPQQQRFSLPTTSSLFIPLALSFFSLHFISVTLWIKIYQLMCDRTAFEVCLHCILAEYTCIWRMCFFILFQKEYTSYIEMYVQMIVLINGKYVSKPKLNTLICIKQYNTHEHKIYIHMLVWCVELIS